MNWHVFERVTTKVGLTGAVATAGVDLELGLTHAVPSALVASAGYPYVDENDIGMVKTGQEVQFTVPAYVDDVFTGSVSAIRLNPEVVSNVVNYTVVVDADNQGGRLLPGMTATVDFFPRVFRCR